MLEKRVHMTANTVFANTLIENGERGGYVEGGDVFTTTETHANELQALGYAVKCDPPETEDERIARDKAEAEAAEREAAEKAAAAVVEAAPKASTRAARA